MEQVTFVLVHCAFGGGWAWKYIAPLLRQAGHTVYTPTLTGMGERTHLGGPDVNLDTHIEDIVSLLSDEDLHDVILVGWSYGGMVVTGVVDRVPERIAQLVYLDGEVPRDGDRSFDFWDQAEVAAMEQRAREAGDGWKAFMGSASDIEPFLRAWIPDAEKRHWIVAEMTSNVQPINTFRQPIRLSNPAADAVPKTLIRCPLDGEVKAGTLDPVDGGDKPFLSVIELASNHMAPIADPELVAEALIGILDKRGQ